MVLYFLASNLHLLMPLQTVIADSDFWNSWVWLNTHLCRDILGRWQNNEISNISSRNKVSIKLLALSAIRKGWRVQLFDNRVTTQHPKMFAIGVIVITSVLIVYIVYILLIWDCVCGYKGAVYLFFIIVFI